ncbi:hypothetical protein [Armatimonas sp.]|uniref:hypothetical protein n=1 Tax=Armatimonas sp. TaxID=1872638 RepID=UPI00286A0E19|nr:hypothetical protein [Armatimonas sp.]
MDEYGFLLWGMIRVCVIAWLLFVVLRWLLTPPHWRDGEGPMVDHGERLTVEFSWLRWFCDIISLKFWRW